MLNKLAGRWWIVAIKGLLTIAFGAMIIISPLLSLVLVVLLFGIDTLLDGLQSVVMSLAFRNKNPQWWQLLIVGIVSSVIGFAVITTSEVSTVNYLYLMATIAIIRGIFQVSTANQLQHTNNGWLLYVAGMMSILFGISAILLVSKGTLVVLAIMAFYAIAIGLIQMIFAYYLQDSYEAHQYVSGILKQLPKKD